MPFIKKTNGKFTLEDKIRMFERMGGTSAVIALLMVILIETGAAGEHIGLVNTGLTAMIVVLAVSLAGSMYFKSRRK